MKALAVVAVLAVVVALCVVAVARAQSPDAAKAAAAPLPSSVNEWTKLAVTPTDKGERRLVFDGPTATLDNLRCHITTLKKGEVSSEPRLHLLEEVIIIKEGTVEASIDGKLQTAGPGSVLFFASRTVTRLRNVGDGPTTYYVIAFATPATPKG
jgi:XRE family transcriptional regulator, regulator of sulfur utilization